MVFNQEIEAKKSLNQITFQSNYFSLVELGLYENIGAFQLLPPKKRQL